MTVFEYIKEKATKEEIAKMFTFLEIAKRFTFLENDSGYYNENNASVLLMLGKLHNWHSTSYEDDKMYNLVMKYLNIEIGDK